MNSKLCKRVQEALRSIWAHRNPTFLLCQKSFLLKMAIFKLLWWQTKVFLEEISQIAKALIKEEVLLVIFFVMWKNCSCRYHFFATIEKEDSGRNLSNTTLEFNCVYCWELYVSKCINISKDLRKYVACVLQKHYRKVQII